MAIQQLKNFITCLTPLFAFGALIISALTFRRQRTLENQNQIFKYKLEQYYKILKAFFDLYIYIDDSISESYEKYKAKAISRNALQNIADEIEKKSDSILDSMIFHTLFLSSEIVKKMDECSDLLNSNYIFFNDNREDYDASMALLDTLGDRLDELEAMMRADLCIDDLHEKLNDRLRNTRKDMSVLAKKKKM